MVSAKHYGCNIGQNDHFGIVRPNNRREPKGSQPNNWSYYTKCKFYIIQGSKIAKMSGFMQIWHLHLLNIRISLTIFLGPPFYFRNLYTKQKNYVIIVYQPFSLAFCAYIFAELLRHLSSAVLVYFCPVRA